VYLAANKHNGMDLGHRPILNVSVCSPECSFRHTIILHVESAPFFVLSTSFCSLFSPFCPHPVHITSSQSTTSLLTSVTRPLTAGVNSAPAWYIFRARQHIRSIICL